MIAWAGRSAAGLIIPVDLPSLEPESAIDRSWEIPPGELLYAPKKVYLGTIPPDLDTLHGRLSLPWYWYWRPGEVRTPLPPLTGLPSLLSGKTR